MAIHTKRLKCEELLTKEDWLMIGAELKTVQATLDALTENFIEKTAKSKMPVKFLKAAQRDIDYAKCHLINMLEECQFGKERWELMFENPNKVFAGRYIEDQQLYATGFADDCITEKSK